jgi:NADH-quinone oxidoreductase subunit N
LVGFIGKFYIFSAAIKEGFIGLAIAAVINSVIAAYYYFIVIKTMYLDKPQKQIEIRPSLALNLALILLLIFTIACGLYPQPILNLSSCALSINLP